MDKPEATVAGRNWWQKFWHQPSRWYLFGIPAGGVVAFVLGIGFTGGFLGALEYSSTNAFCTSCHTMETPKQEYQQSVHYSNALGIRAQCVDCHITPKFLPGLIEHMTSGGKDTLAQMLGTISTPAKYEAHRLAMANDVWAQMKAQDSATCRSCHTADAMALDKQDRIAAKRHDPAYLAKTGKTCIDCHRGVAHTLPDGA